MSKNFWWTLYYLVIIAAVVFFTVMIFREVAIYIEPASAQCDDSITDEQFGCFDNCSDLWIDVEQRICDLSPDQSFVDRWERGVICQ